jgi:hypothetical protein
MVREWEVDEVPMLRVCTFTLLALLVTGCTPAWYQQEMQDCATYYQSFQAECEAIANARLEEWRRDVADSMPAVGDGIQRSAPAQAATQPKASSGRICQFGADCPIGEDCKKEWSTSKFGACIQRGH